MPLCWSSWFCLQTIQTFSWQFRNLSTIITMINKELKLITEWFRVNKLSINVNKTNFILFTSPRKNYSSHTVVDKILINDIPIKQVHSVVSSLECTWTNTCSGVTMLIHW